VELYLRTCLLLNASDNMTGQFNNILTGIYNSTLDITHTHTHAHTRTHARTRACSHTFCFHTTVQPALGAAIVP